jgi:hypothetical protein
MLVGSQLILRIPTQTVQKPADTTAYVEPTTGFMHHRHGWRGIVGGLACLAVVIYVLWLATRVVRAIEKAADKFQGRAS